MVQYSNRSMIYAEKKSTRMNQQNLMFLLIYYNLKETFSWYTLYVDYFSFNNGGCELFPYIFKYSKDILMNG